MTKARLRGSAGAIAATFVAAGCSSGGSGSDATPLSSPGDALKNGDFETGDLTSWFSTGPNVISTDAHGGKFAAQVGATGAFSGTAVLSQQIHVPATGTTTLSFFYNPHCSDSIEHDFQQAQIRSPKGESLGIFNICSDAAVWKNTTVDLTGYAGQEIVVYYGDHDDDGPDDPTYMLIDDVSVTNR
jgi:hypothetical protein